MDYEKKEPKEKRTFPKQVFYFNDEGELVIEDPKYCASVAFTVGSWIEMLDKYTPE